MSIEGDALKRFRQIKGLLKEESLRPHGDHLDFGPFLKRIGDSMPAIHPDLLELDLKKIRSTMGEVLKILWEDPGVRNQQGAIEGLMGEDEVLKGYIRALLKRDFDRLKGLINPSDPSEETVNIFIYLITQSLRPTLEVIKSGLADHLLNWEGNRCPICGYPPGLATLREEGSLSLYCSLCWQVWDYRRLRCPFCSNEDPSTLGYFQVEGEPGYRVYYCDMCHGYIKTLDMREAFPISDPEEESLKTLALDILATRKGYSPKTWESL